MNRLACRVMVAIAGMAVLGMTATVAGAQTHPAAYTLNDVMQAPFASDMLAAPTGAAVAWVFNAKGCSNIWVADPTHGAKARQITPYTEDAGFDIGELSARLNRAVSACAREIHKSVRQQEENGKPDYFFAFTR